MNQANGTLLPASGRLACSAPNYFSVAPALTISLRNPIKWEALLMECWLLPASRKLLCSAPNYFSVAPAPLTIFLRDNRGTTCSAVQFNSFTLIPFQSQETHTKK